MEAKLQENRQIENDTLLYYMAGRAATAPNLYNNPAMETVPEPGNTGSGYGTGPFNLNGRGNGSYYRYMSEAEYKAVQETGYLRGGNAGTTYFTNTKYNSAATAQSQLSLPNMPQYMVEFRIINNVDVIGGTVVAPDFGQLGGGIEFWSKNPVQVQIINAIPIP